MIAIFKFIGLSTYQKTDSSKGGINITIASIFKAYIQRLALTRAPSGTDKCTFLCSVYSCKLRIPLRALLLDVISAEDYSGNSHIHMISIQLYKGPPWHIRKPLS